MGVDTCFELAPGLGFYRSELSLADVALLKSAFGVAWYDAYDEPDWFFVPFEKSSLDYDGYGVGITGGVPFSKEVKRVCTKPTLALIKPMKFTKEEITDNIRRKIRELEELEELERLERQVDRRDVYSLEDEEEEYDKEENEESTFDTDELVKLAVAHGHGGKWLAIYYQ
jgi:hypothetical protein